MIIFLKLRLRILVRTKIYSNNSGVPIIQIYEINSKGFHRSNDFFLLNGSKWKGLDSNSFLSYHLSIFRLE